MENKHTSGNWNVERVESKYFNGFRINRQPNGGTEIARIRYVEEPEESERVLKELEANAKLIAAAPELLEALKEAKKSLQFLAEKGFWNADCATMNQIKDAITKAT